MHWIDVNKDVDDDLGDNDNGDDDARARRPSARLHGSPSAPADPENPTDLSPLIKPILLSRPRKSDPPIDQFEAKSSSVQEISIKQNLPNKT